MRKVKEAEKATANKGTKKAAKKTVKEAKENGK